MGACSSSPAAVATAEQHPPLPNNDDSNPINASILRKKGDRGISSDHGVKFTNSTEQDLGTFLLLFEIVKFVVNVCLIWY